MIRSGAKATTTVVLTTVAVAVAVSLVACSGAQYQAGRRPTAAYAEGTWGTGTTPWLAPQTADALSAELAAALDGTGWCAGWVVNVDDVFSRSSDVGSNRGVGTAAHTCDQWAEITVEVVYTSESSEGDDTAGIRVDGHVPGLTRSLQEHPALLDGTGYEALLSDSGDDAVANAVAGLPAALAELGHIDPLAAAPTESAGTGGFTAPDAGGAGGSDTVTQRPLELYLGIACLVLAGITLVGLLVGHLAGRSSRPFPAASAGGRPRRSEPRASGGTAAPPPVTNPRRALRKALDSRQTAAPRS